MCNGVDCKLLKEKSVGELLGNCPAWNHLRGLDGGTQSKIRKVVLPIRIWTARKSRHIYSLAGIAAREYVIGCGQDRPEMSRASESLPIG